MQAEVDLYIRWMQPDTIRLWLSPRWCTVSSVQMTGYKFTIYYINFMLFSVLIAFPSFFRAAVTRQRNPPAGLIKLFLWRCLLLCVSRRSNCKQGCWRYIVKIQRIVKVYMQRYLLIIQTKDSSHSNKKRMHRVADAGIIFGSQRSLSYCSVNHKRILPPIPPTWHRNV